eukprot:1468337-Rhodomonas_salina.2
MSTSPYTLPTSQQERQRGLRLQRWSGGARESSPTHEKHFGDRGWCDMISSAGLRHHDSAGLRYGATSSVSVAINGGSASINRTTFTISGACSCLFFPTASNGFCSRAKHHVGSTVLAMLAIVRDGGIGARES